MTTDSDSEYDSGYQNETTSKSYENILIQRETDLSHSIVDFKLKY